MFPGVHYTPNTEYDMYSYAKGTCKNAEYAGDHIISLPCHIAITYQDVQKISELVKDYILNR